VKFPPHIPVEQVIGYPRFGLSKDGVTMKVEAWSDDPDPVEVLVDAWLQIRGLLPPWCEWNIIDQAVSTLGLLQEIDWASVFRNCAEILRVKIACRDPEKIPPARLYNLHGKLVQLLFHVEKNRGDVITRGEPHQGGQSEDGTWNGNGPGSKENMDTDKSGGEKTANPRSSNLPKQNLPGNQRTARCAVEEKLMEEETITGTEMYDLLVHKGAISSNGLLDWCFEDTEEGKKEAEEF
jgi:hypothetical protein